MVCVIIEVVIGVAMALIMNRAFRGRSLIRASILVPWAIPTVVSALLWKWIFNANGIANTLLGKQVLWSTDGIQAQLAVIIADTWKTAPFIGLLVLAGLQVIPDEVYEAAKIDGVGAWNSFLHITLPLVKPALLVAVLFRILDNLRMFDLPYVLIGKGKPSVETLSILAQQESVNTRYGPAAAYAMLLFIYLVIVAYAFVKLLGADVIGDDAGEPKTKVKGQHEVEDRPQRREGRQAVSTEAPSAPSRRTTRSPTRPPPRKVKPATAGGDRAQDGLRSTSASALIIIYCLAPFYWMIVSSLRRTADIFETRRSRPRRRSRTTPTVFDPVNNFAPGPAQQHHRRRHDDGRWC